MKKNRCRWTDEEKAAIVCRFKTSGLTQEAFAKEVGVSGNSISNWLRLEKKGLLSGKSQELIPVRVKRSGHSVSPPSFEIMLKSGRTLRVPEGFDEQELLRVIAVLEAC